MDSLGIARWQFGITTVYHFLFVPITIGMAYFIAITETAWVRTRNPIYLRAAKFWGKIFLINFAMGVVTGHGAGVPVRDELVELLPVRR